ncbi:MAG: M28 family peptidase [Gemmatimonadaceae bacterium]
MITTHPLARTTSPALVPCALAALAALTQLAACARSAPDTAPVPASMPAASPSSPAATPAVTPATRAPLPLKHAPEPTGAAISPADLMTRLYIFADDSMMGREVGTPGNVKGTAYIAEEARRMGLQPAGDNGTYFQVIPYSVRTFDAASKLSVDGTALTMWTDYAPMPARGTPRSLDGVQAVYGGVLGDTTRTLTRAQMAGKLVVLSVAGGGMGLPAIRSDNPLLAAAGVAIANLENVPANVIAIYRNTSSSSFGDAGAPIPIPMFITTRAATLLLGTAPASATLGATGKTVRGTVGFTTTGAPARNVVAVLPGSDLRLKGQYVAIGAHNDHVGAARQPVDHDSLKAFNTVMRPEGLETQVMGNPTGDQWARISAIRDSLRTLGRSHVDTVNNGADDDGSGSVSVLEIAESMAMAPAKPARSMLFVWHTGEEAGLLGSEWFTEHPTVPRDSIVAQLNIDMVGRGGVGDVPNGGPANLQLVGSRRLSTELGDLVETMNKARPQPFTFDYQYDAARHPQQIYCRSDHASYARYGIPVVFFTTGVHPDYHMPTDEPQYIDYTHMATVAQFIHDIALRVASLDHRMVVDKPKPADPKAGCQQ